MEGPLILDRYRPLGELGEGGFGTVVLAWDTRMQRRVAIKRLPLPTDSSGHPLHPPGLAEARTAAMLNQTNIVTVYDFDTDSDEAFLVMEHVSGASLAEVLERSGCPLTLDEVAAVVEGVADALDFAHDNGVLHLDVKPENILITRNGTVKVADFGISALSSLSGHGAAPGGTLGYMPAEQLEGQPVSARTDEWALAALTFEMLTGTNPFLEATLDAARRRARLEPPVPSDYEHDLPSALDDALFVALSPEPNDRYLDVVSFADALLEHLGDPGLGRESLAELIDSFVEEEPDEEFGLDAVGLWDRLRGGLGSALVRSIAAAESGWLAWTGLTPLSLERPALLAAVALAAAAGALAPSLGVALALGCLVAGLVANAMWPPALAVAVGASVWWWLVARHDAGAAVLPLSAPLLGAIRIGLAQPLIAGFGLDIVPAAVTGLLGGALTMFASAATLQAPPYTAVSPEIALSPWHLSLATTSLTALVTSPATYLALLGWPLAAAAMSMGCARATRFGAALGAVGGAAALGGTSLLAGRVAATSAHPELAAGWSGPALALSLGASLILILSVVALGAPIRAEEDAPPEHQPAHD